MKWCPLLICLFLLRLPTWAQHPHAVFLQTAKFTTGDDPRWAQPAFDDAAWKQQEVGKTWQEQGFEGYHGFAWYRIHITIPSSLRQQGFWKDSLRIFLAHVNDVDATYLNGKKIGQTGGFPEDAGGYQSKWPAVREYHLALNDPAIHWDADNVIAVRDYDGGGTGGIFMGRPYIDLLERTDGLQISGGADAALTLVNTFNAPVSGTLTYTITDEVQHITVRSKTEVVQLAPFGQRSINMDAPNRQGIVCSYRFTEDGSGLQLQHTQAFPYILTPAAPQQPRINGAKIFGARPGAPLSWRVAATGAAPLHYQVAGLPEGLQVDASTGIITGMATRRGIYKLTATVQNRLGKTSAPLTLHIGDTLACTPTMGWNSWNCWGLSVSDQKVKSSAQAMLDKGLAAHGWTYINIDDGWEAPQRAADSSIVPNSKFPDMQGLGQWLHERGLKFGIYSSPGPLTCGGFLGSYKNEQKDADSYAAWGVDYLKYDWCSYDGIAGNDTTLEAFIKPYRVMQQALRSHHRDIIYSLCQYGMKEVWKWGQQVDAQSWRTTEDIEDTWESLLRIGFSQYKVHTYAGPGHWNDPDMMIVGQVGWGENLHPSRLTPDEQYTHVSLWCLQSAPLLIGCDLSKLDAFTLNLLTNDEVLALDQDPLGAPAERVQATAQEQVWVKKLADGSRAVGIFNMDTTYRDITIDWKALGLEAWPHTRNAWTQTNIPRPAHSVIPPHGVLLLRCSR